MLDIDDNYESPFRTLQEQVAYLTTIIEEGGGGSGGITPENIGDYAVVKIVEADKLYGTDNLGAQTSYSLETGVTGVVARRDSNGQLKVPQTPVADEDATSKKYVDTIIANIKKDHYQLVDISTYPTLADFLASTGEEGWLYLYPIDTSEAPTYPSGFYRFIWENNTWMSLGTTQIDLSGYVDLTSAQTITGTKTFDPEIKIGVSGGYTVHCYNGYTRFKQTGGVGYYVSTAKIYPDGNDYDLGDSNHRWKDLYLSGVAYAQNTFNVINASDIVSNTLTQAQYDLIINGKPTLIKGTYQSKNNVIWQLQRIGETSAILFYIGELEIGVVLVNISTKVITYRSADQRNIRLQSVDTFNGKTVPSYPSSTGTFVLKCVNGILTWVVE